jgi:hypothetical protein
MNMKFDFDEGEGGPQSKLKPFEQHAIAKLLEDKWS